MRTHALTWTVDRASHDGLVRRSAPRGTTHTATTPTLGVWLLLGTIAATTLAMGAVIVWAAPTIATDAILTAMARL